ncbi:Type 1 glutamine amidotransferase-like domain-containing protein [Thomasclavelia saccharogumia]|uniref:Type 1 glutamine amidotransferase-like domain-containing protein n=1 Tax=Thomasclavelia saccharogumia TaxID=341225 RepID=UPI00054F6AF4|nr:Type 1 glutamine amidotransferase-like domain-containing protein [Thomasclavelia saccharogumia]
MVVFLTSSPTGPLDGSRKVDGLDKKNNFVGHLKQYWKENSRCCLIASDPDNFAMNDEMTNFFKKTFLKEKFSIQDFNIIDRRNYNFTQADLHQYDVIILGGGHVPTQNMFFKDIQLRNKITGFTGIVIGISAGSMNSADIVYCQPEKNGEAIDETFEKWLPGLNLTKMNILPHYQTIKDSYLDGMRLFEDITYKDSMNHQFIALVDGSYVLIDKHETIYGESYLISDGNIRLLCHENESVII